MLHTPASSGEYWPLATYLYFYMMHTSACSGEYRPIATYIDCYMLHTKACSGEVEYRLVVTYICRLLHAAQPVNITYIYCFVLHTLHLR